MTKHDGERMAVIPFGFKYIGVRKLALVNFEKDPDEYYMGLEPQWIEQTDGVSGYRVVAYRLDGYVDVYDEPVLSFDSSESFDVTGKGLCERIMTPIENAEFQRVDEQLTLGFSFHDKYNRQVRVRIEEHLTKPSKGISLLAPVGSSSESPTYLPVFFLYGFDFVRKRDTKVSVTVDDQAFAIDLFPYPVPKDRQWRYYTRYSDDCQIVEFASAIEGTLSSVPISDGGIVELENVSYSFSKDSRLQSMKAVHQPHPFEIRFSEGIPDVRKLAVHEKVDGTFSIHGKPEMGRIAGIFSLERVDRTVTLVLNTVEGWHAEPDSLFTKMMFSRKSLLSQWPSSYEYKQEIDLNTLHSVSGWKRIESAKAEK